MLGFQKAISLLEEMQRRPLHEPRRNRAMFVPLEVKGWLSGVVVVVRVGKWSW
jgi:hypothetical protein